MYDPEPVETPSEPAQPGDAKPDVAQPVPVPEWESDEFKQKVREAGFPGSPHTDPAFLAALYRFGQGADAPKAE